MDEPSRLLVDLTGGLYSRLDQFQILLEVLCAGEVVADLVVLGADTTTVVFLCAFLEAYEMQDARVRVARCAEDTHGSSDALEDVQRACHRLGVPGDLLESRQGETERSPGGGLWRGGGPE